MSLKEIVILLSALSVVFGVGVEGEPESYVAYHSNLEKSPYFWKIKSSPPSYLFGTIHVPYTKVWQHVSEEAITAFDSARQVYLELENPVTCPSQLPPNQTLAQVRQSLKLVLLEELRIGVRA